MDSVLSEMPKGVVCSQFCDALRRHPFIWYKDYPGRYIGNREWDREWESIAAELGQPKNTVKNKWKAYRAQFNRILKGLPPLRPDQDITEYLKPQYKTSHFFKHLLFLADSSKANLTPAELNGEHRFKELFANTEQLKTSIPILRKVIRENQLSQKLQSDGNTKAIEVHGSITNEEDNALEEVARPNEGDIGSTLNDDNNFEIDDNGNQEEFTNDNSSSNDNRMSEKNDDEFDDIEDDEPHKCELKQADGEFLANDENKININQKSERLSTPQSHCTIDESANVKGIGNDVEILDSNSPQSSKAIADKNAITTPESFGKDENSLFLRSLLPYLRQMDPAKQAQARMNLEEIMIGALLNRNS